MVYGYPGPTQPPAEPSLIGWDVALSAAALAIAGLVVTLILCTVIGVIGGAGYVDAVG